MEEEDSNVWSQVAEDYITQVEPFTSLFAKDMLEAAQVRANDTVLETGCGTGALTAMVAKQAKAVTAIDLSKHMLVVLERRLKQDGVFDNVTIRVGDCSDLRTVVDPNCFDVSMSCFCIPFLPDPQAGVVELWRATKPGGRVVVNAWGDKSETPAFAVIPTLVTSVTNNNNNDNNDNKDNNDNNDNKDNNEDNKGDKANLRIDSNEDSLRHLMTEAGLVNVTVSSTEHSLRMANAEAYWRRMATAAPGTRNLLTRLSNPEQQALQRAVIANLVKKFGEGEVVLPARAYLGCGEKPL